MKTRTLICLLPITALFIYASCNKEKGEDPHNHSLLNKSLSEIRNKIAGTWKFQYDSSNGIAGPQRGPYYTDNSYLNFLPKDSIRWTINGNAIINDTIIITKGYSFSYPFDVYIFSFNSGIGFQYSWTMDQIRNDTLVIEDGFIAGGGLRYYLTRH